MIGGLAPQPRLLWAVGIGAGLIALAIVSPVLGFVAVIYHAGLVIIATRDLALLPGGSGYFVRRGPTATLLPCSAGGHTHLGLDTAAAGREVPSADHAAAAAKPTHR